MRQCPVIDTMPVVPDEGCDEQEERAVRLVEVRHHPTDEAIAVAGRNDDARGEDQMLLSLRLQVAEERVKGFGGRQLLLGSLFVGQPLLYVKGCRCGIGMTAQCDG